MAIDMGKALPYLAAFIALFLFAFIGFLAVNYAYKKDKKEPRESDKMVKSDKALKIASIIFNCVWVVLLIPIVPVSFMAMVSTFMMSASGEVTQNLLFMGLMILTAFMFVAIPVVILICVGISFYFRKKLKMLLSVLVQIIPAIYIILTVGMLVLLFGVANLFF